MNNNFKVDELNEEETYYFHFIKRQITKGYLKGDERYERTFDLTDEQKLNIFNLVTKEIHS